MSRWVFLMPILSVSCAYLFLLLLEQKERIKNLEAEIKQLKGQVSNLVYVFDKKEKETETWFVVIQKDFQNEIQKVLGENRDN